MVLAFAVLLATSLADFYAVTLGGISPGERMFMDRAAPTVVTALAFVVTFGFALFGAFSLRQNSLTMAKQPGASFRPTPSARSDSSP